MKWNKIVRDAWLGLARHRLRNLLSSLGIVFAVMAVTAMLAIAEGAKREILEQIGQLGTNQIIVRRVELTSAQATSARRHLSHGLVLSDAHTLENAIPQIANVAPLRKVKAALPASNPQDPFEILATTDAYLLAKNMKIMDGRFISQADVYQKNLVCVLGHEVKDVLGESGHVGATLRIEDRIYTIVGILQNREWKDSKSSVLAIRNYNRAIFIPMGSSAAVSGDGRGHEHIIEIWIRIKQNADTRACAKAVRSILERKHGGVEDFQVIVPQELLFQAQRTQRNFNIVLGSIAGISLLVGGIGIMNTMLASVAERTREIGIRRAIGASRKHIVIQFITEAVILTTVGGCIGLVSGIGCAVIISILAGWNTAITFWSLTISLVMATAVGLASGLYPALRAAQLEPVLALRHE